MAEEKRALWRNKTLQLVVVIVVVLGVTFGGGWWFADRHERSVASVVDSYVIVYGGTDSTKDVVDLLPLYAADGVLRDAAADRTYEGVTEIKAALDALFATAKLDVTVEQTSIGDDFATVRWTADGTDASTGRLAQVTGLTVLEISKGKIVNETWYYDPAKAPF